MIFELNKPNLWYLLKDPHKHIFAEKNIENTNLLLQYYKYKKQTLRKLLKTETQTMHTHLQININLYFFYFVVDRLHTPNGSQTHNLILHLAIIRRESSSLANQHKLYNT